MNQYSKLDIDIMLGLDDMAHNRFYSFLNGLKGEKVRSSNWGARNRKEMCYCEILKKLGVKR